MTLDTTGALSEYDAAVDAMTGSVPVIEPRVDATQAISAYEPLCKKRQTFKAKECTGMRQ